MIHKLRIYINSIKGDIRGGLTASLVSIPGGVAYGILAFSPLGEKYYSLGAVAGIICSVFNGILSSLLGGTPVMISGPKGSITLMIQTIIVSLMTRIGTLKSPEEIIAAALFAVFLSGLVQFIFGLTGIGNFIKFIPYPIIAGIINGTAILIMFSQLWLIFGYNSPVTLQMFFARANEIKPLTLLISIVTVVVILGPKKFHWKLPNTMAGLFLGTLLYHLFSVMGLQTSLGPLLGTIQIGMPTPDIFMKFLKIPMDPIIRPALLEALPAILMTAILLSIDTLLNSLAVENLTLKKTDCNKELIGQGAGNMASALFGGIAGAGTSSRALANYMAGGRTKLSGAICGISIFIFVYFLSPLLKLIPTAVMGAVLFSIAVQMVDPWSKKTFAILSKGFRGRLNILLDAAVVLIVMFIALAVDIVYSVIAGLFASIVLLLTKTNKSIIRNEFSGGKIFSKRQRSSDIMGILQSEGKKIAVFELEGFVVFGSVDNFYSHVEEVSQYAKYIILDFRRVYDVDISGARSIEKLAGIMKNKGAQIYLTNIENHVKMWNFLKDNGIVDGIGEEHFYPDTDHALESAEDQLISDYMVEQMQEMDESGPTHSDGFSIYDLYEIQYNGVPLDQTRILKNLTPKELSVVKKLLREKKFSQGENIFRQGDEGSDLYIILRGSASVNINIGGGRKKRLIVFSAGTIFGEMALLDHKPRSAEVTADEETVCSLLSSSDFDLLKKKHSSIAIKILENINFEIVDRLRISHSIISELED